jgi:hypothetical protein
LPQDTGQLPTHAYDAELTDDVLDATDHVLHGIGLIAEARSHKDPFCRSIADRSWTALLDAVDADPSGPVERTLDSPIKSFRLGAFASELERRAGGATRLLTRGARRVLPAWAHTSRFRDIWALLHLLMSVAIAVLLIDSQWLWAFMVMALRVSGSLAWGPSLYPMEHSVDQEPSTRRDSGVARVNRCLSGHVADGVVMGGITLALASAGRSGWALFIAAVLYASQMATINRLGSWQCGALLDRLRAERIFRNGSVLIALAGTAAQRGIPASGVPVIVIAGAGFLAYALLEVLRSQVWMRFRARSGASVVVVVRAGNSIKDRKSATARGTGKLGVSGRQGSLRRVS